MAAVLDMARRRKGAESGATDKSADVILIPKHLRMEWTDVLALDASLSLVAFRVACVIGVHLNKRRGDAYPGQDTIARHTRLSKSSVQRAIRELERAGYLIVQRRELGERASDGRRVCGGRGIANTYLPAFEGTQVAATNAGGKLAACCRQWLEERSQEKVVSRDHLSAPKVLASDHLSAKERWSNESEKVVTGDHPTLTHPSGENPARARAREGRARPRGSAHLSPVVDWGEAGERLRSRIGGDVFASWFGEIAIESADGRSVRLSTSKRTVRDWLRANFEAAIAAAFMVDRVVIEVRKPAGASPEEGAGPSSAGGGGSHSNRGNSPVRLAETCVDGG